MGALDLAIGIVILLSLNVYVKSSPPPSVIIAILTRVELMIAARIGSILI